MARCKDCVHVDVCEDFTKAKLSPKRAEELLPVLREYGRTCDHFKDRAQFVELPCRVGDSVFTIDNKENIQECTVINVNCKTQLTLDKKLWIDFIIVTEPVDDSLPFQMIFTYSIAKNRILFLTKEYAEQALREREKDGM